jgi:hypothetical protein
VLTAGRRQGGRLVGAVDLKRVVAH